MSTSAAPASLWFTEDMKGYVGFGESDVRTGAEKGHAAGSALMFHLTITVADVARFVDDPARTATAEGFVRCAALGGDRPVVNGRFQLFVDGPPLATRRMTYRLHFHDAAGRPLTLRGFKEVKDDKGADVWADTSTLYTQLVAGHVGDAPEGGEVLAAGILHILKLDFLHQLTTLRVQGPDLRSRVTAAGRFGRLFLGSLWDVYGVHVFPPLNLEPVFRREIPLYTLEGVRDADVTTHWFSTGDRLGLSLTRFLRQPCDDVVLVIHGLTTSTDMFVMPEHDNLVSYLLDHGYTDVWCLDFRMSNRFSYNLSPHRYTMDDIALFDFPAAVETVRKAVGDRRLHVICHCLGSVSFMMSLFGGAVTGIRSVIANSVALTPKVPRWSKVKLTFSPFLLEYVAGFPAVNPRWSEDPGLRLGKSLAWANSLFHRECDVSACHMLSLMWGSGHPALYSHENLHDVTHRRGGDLYGATSVHYYRHVRRMVAAGNTAVKFNPREPRHAALPDNYLDRAREIETPVLLMTGSNNRVFTDSNVECFRRLDRLAPGRHRLRVFEGYGHQDVFMGKNNHRDIFPPLVEFLDGQRGPLPA
jgi:cholesterol oxidase